MNDPLNVYSLAKVWIRYSLQNGKPFFHCNGYLNLSKCFSLYGCLKNTILFKTNAGKFNNRDTILTQATLITHASKIHIYVYVFRKYWPDFQFIPCGLVFDLHLIYVWVCWFQWWCYRKQSLVWVSGTMCQKRLLLHFFLQKLFSYSKPLEVASFTASVLALLYSRTKFISKGWKKFLVTG